MQKLGAPWGEKSMFTKRVLLGLATLIFLVGAASPQFEYAEGQVWEYRTRPGDEGSLLRIQEIEALAEFADEGPAYHISIIGVRFTGPLAGELQHAPVSRQSLDASVTRLADTEAAFPEPDEGIAQWRAAQGGVFTIPIAEVVGFIEQAVRQQVPD